MGIRTGAEYRQSLRDNRTIYANGERIKDVTTYPPFQGIVETLAEIEITHKTSVKIEPSFEARKV